MKVRILHVIASGAIGGGSVHVRYTAAQLQQQGIDCAVACDDDGPLGQQCIDAGIPWYQVPLMQRAAGIGDWGLYRRFQALLRSFRPDLIHLHGTRAAWYWSLLIARESVIPALYTAHGFAFRRQDGWLRAMGMAGVERFVCRSVQGVITVANADRAELLGRGWLSASNVHHLGNAVAPVFFTSSHGKSHLWRQQVGVAEATWCIGTTARLVPQKGLDIFLEGCARQPWLRGLVAGDGPLAKQFQQHQAVRSGRVLMLGGGQAIPTYLANLQAFALTSRWEGEPIALLEAMAAGVVCIASATPGARELLADGERGMLFPIDDVDGFVQACNHVRRDAHSVERMRQAAHHFVQQRSYRNLTRKLLVHYGQYCPKVAAWLLQQQRLAPAAASQPASKSLPLGSC